MGRVSELNKGLIALETELRLAGLWSKDLPRQEQLKSREPFCVDTLPFEGWLQWVFIPNMLAMLAMPQFDGLTHRSDIHSMADYVFSQYSTDTTSIVASIKHIDALLNSFYQQSLH